MAVDVQLAAGHFPAGTKVQIIPRVGDFAAGTAIKTVSAKDDGVQVKGLDEGRYWAVADVETVVPVTGGIDRRTVQRSVSFTAKDTLAPRQRTAAPTSADPQLTPTWTTDQPEIITGPKGTKVAGRTAEEPIQKGIEPHPHLNQASIAGNVPQRSSTVLGQATPVDPDEPQPKPRQDSVKRGVKQRSDTELGEATPISPDAGPDKQEDAGKNLKQRSDTETGEATPIGSAEPRGTASNPDSREQAAGERPTDEKTSKKDVKPDAAAKVKATPRSKQKS